MGQKILDVLVISAQKVKFEKKTILLVGTFIIYIFLYIFLLYIYISVAQFIGEADQFTFKPILHCEEILSDNRNFK